MAEVIFPGSPVVNDEFSAAGITWKWDGSVWNIVPANPGPSTKNALFATFDGMGAVVTVNSIAYVRARSGVTITGFSIIAEGTNPTCTIDVLKIADGTVLPTASICGGVPAQLTTGNAVNSLAVGSWSVFIESGAILAFKVTACSGATKINFVLNTE